jgi:RNA polymerase sigma-70 factor (ECF subfamily)
MPATQPASGGPVGCKVSPVGGKIVMSDSSSLDTRPSLLLRLRDARDAAAWETFVDTYGPLVYGYCRGKGLQEADAADVTQDVLGEVARSMPAFRYDPGRGRFRGWLGTLTRRRLARFLDGRQRRVPTSAGDEGLADVAGPEEDPEWTTAFHQAVLQAALQRVRLHFESPTWAAFERTWIEDRPPAAVAAELGIPLETVYVAKSRVLKALREKILELSEDLPLAGPAG